MLSSRAREHQHVWHVIAKRNCSTRPCGLVKMVPFKTSVVEKFIPPVAYTKALSTPQQIRIIIMDPKWVNIVKDELKKSL